MDEKTIKDILKEYQFTRDRKKDELEERIEKLYTKYPDIKSISKEIQNNGLEMTKLTIESFGMEKADSNSNQEILNLEKRIASLEEKEKFLIDMKARLLEKYNIPSSYLEMQYDCTKCNDTGFIPSGKKCSCLKQRLINEAYKRSNMINLLEIQNFDTFNLDLFPNKEYMGINIRKMMSMTMRECYNYAVSFPNVSDLDSQGGKDNLIFIGDAGLGKTFLCSCIAKEILDRGYTVVYMTAFELLEVIERYKFKRENYSYRDEENYDKIFSCDLLIIDDLGTEMPNSFTISEIFNVINSRIINTKKTIISTNLTFEKLQETYTDRVVSRILGHYKVYVLVGEDLRFGIK